MKRKRKILWIVLVALAMVNSVITAQQPASTGAVQVIGLPGVKNNTKGNLKVENGTLIFDSSNSNSDVPAASIQDVITAEDSQRAIRGTVGTISHFVPYGGGTFFSLLRNKIDTLTIEYRDANGGLHGAIFTMEPGKAGVIKEALLAQGAHTSIPSTASAPELPLQSEAQEPVR